MHAMRTSVVLSLSKIEMNIEKISNGRNKFLLNKLRNSNCSIYHLH